MVLVPGTVNNDKITCKKVVGQTVCKVGSAIVLPKEPSTVDVYTSNDCTWCYKEIKTFKKKAKRLGAMVKVQVKNIDHANNIDMDELGVFPMVDFGNGIVERGRISKMEDGEILSRVLESARNGKLMKNYQ